MLTLQQLLESDSIATIVAKLNQNFQTLSNSNGGPQGIRGYQGIPGLPGRLGPTGSTGPVGPTGTILGIVPFACMPGTGPTAIGVGPTAGGGTPISSLSPYGTVGPWPQSSWQWLQYYETPGGGGFGGNTAQHGDIYIDHANNGYWQWLNYPDDPGACDGTGGFTSGGAYSYTGASSYPALGPTAGWGGSGWYYYPVSTGSGATSAVWAQDFTTYLRGNTGGTPNGPYIAGQYLNDNTSALTIANARLITKYGTVWISSGNDATTALNSADPNTPTIGNWGKGRGASVPQPAKTNAGIERILFKMSLDGMSYLGNVSARGYTGLFPPGAQPAAASLTHPITSSGTAMQNWKYWVKPQYSVSMDKFSPLLFLSHREEEDVVLNGTYGSLGIYMYTDTTPPSYTPVPAQVLGNDSQPYNNNNVSKSLHLFSTRFSPDPFQMYATPALSPVTSNNTLNFGELLLDFRRVVASNQYVSSLPVDMKLSSDYLDNDGLGNLVYTESNAFNLYKNRTFQGYISAINGKALTGNPTSADYWEYGLGPTGPAGSTSGTHDTNSGTAGMRTRRTWYGSSVLRTLPSAWDGSTPPGTNDYIRVAGMMERGRRFESDILPGGGTGATAGWFYSELLFYTSHFNVASTALTGNPASVTNAQVNPDSNQHKSLPALYVSPFRNIGIGTFIGANDLTGNALLDEGPLEPLARLHVHTKRNSVYDDPTYTYKELTGATSTSAPWGNLLPTHIYSAAAFSGEYGATGTNPQYTTDVLIGTLLSGANFEYAKPQRNVVNYIGGATTPSNDTYLTNALRSEAWRNYRNSTLRLGASPSPRNHSIGKGSVLEFPVEFQLALHPLTPSPTGATAGGPTAIQYSPLRVITGVGVHNQYPRTRVHFFGKNAYNETDFGQQLWGPGYSIAGINPYNIGIGAPYGLPTASYPYYGTGITALNSPSNNQIAIDYIGSTYYYPVGIYEYQYYAYGATSSPGSTGTSSPNAAVYPNRESLSPTRHAVPWYSEFNNSTAFPSIGASAIFNNSYKHGGERNAWFPASSYIGFNLYRDLSEASGLTGLAANTSGDDRDVTRWVIGTSPEVADSSGNVDAGNNGAAALMFSPKGELGIVTIPRGRDGGHAYHQWEQRGLGTRDVLNQMKIVFDTYGNIAVGNAAGWDLDAYPSLERNTSTGYLNYVPAVNPTTTGPQDATTSGNTAGRWASNAGQYGRVTYGGETSGGSQAALINARATQREYVRLEVAAEKAWSRDGRMATKGGYGYPPNRQFAIPAGYLERYIVTNGFPLANISTWTMRTDNEGRIVRSELSLGTPNIGLTAGSFSVITYPHPTEFNTGGPANLYATAVVPPLPVSYTTPAGALAAEWAGMNIDVNIPSDQPSIIDISGGAGSAYALIHTVDTRGSANIRLNNYVYGEGFGFSGNTGPQGTGATAGIIGTAGYNSGTAIGSYTKNLVKQKRQESPKIILSFLEKDPVVSRIGSLLDPYKKVNTVIASAQNESSLREYWIPKTDNTGGTFMVWTDNMGQKEKDGGFDKTLTSFTGLTAGGVTGNANKLKVVEVITLEPLPSWTAAAAATVTGVTSGQGSNAAAYNMGYVRYYNQASYAFPGASFNSGGLTAGWAANDYGRIVRTAQNVPMTSVLGNAGGVLSGLTAPYNGNTAAVFAASERNIDYYYKVYYGSTANYNNGWDNPDFQNRATEIRYKRINSEFVLFDFNITLEVMNPVLPGGSTALAEDYLDKQSPRMTQAVKFVYEVDENADNDFTESLYGSGPWFSSWSSYRNWHAGAAAVGDDLITNYSPTAFDRQSAVNFASVLTLPNVYGTMIDDSTWTDWNDIRTWNGNFIDVSVYGSTTLPSPTSWLLGSIFSIGTEGPNYPYSINLNNQVTPAFSASPINLSIGAYIMDYTTAANVQALSFGKNLQYFYSVWGNNTLSRHRNMMWKVTPIRWTNNSVSTPASGSTDLTRNTFMIDVSFDVPIMHSFHEFNGPIFGNNGNTGASYPYRYLTLSGQHILRYGKTTFDQTQLSPGFNPGI